MPLAPLNVTSRLHTGWFFVAGCVLAALCVDLSAYHASHQADSLIPILVSLYKWEPFYWGQNRLGMLVPLAASPFEHPFTNLLVQNAITIFGGFTALGVIAWYLLRDRTWAGVGAAAVVLFLFAFPSADQFHVLNGAHPYLIPLAMALAGIGLVATPGPNRLGRALAGLALTLAAYWYNVGLPVAMGPLVLGRFLAASVLDGPNAGRESAQGTYRRLRAVPGLPEFVVSFALIAVGLVFGRWLATFSLFRDTHFGFLYASEWLECWGKLAAGTWLQFSEYLLAVAGIAVLGLGWLAVPATRPAAVRSWAAFGVVVFAFVAQWLALGTIAWVKTNEYGVRYLYPGLAALAPGAAAVLFGPLLAVLRATTVRKIGWGTIAALPAAAVATYGVPSVQDARTAVTQTAGAWTDDLLAANCTHVVGNYWIVWPATFHVNMRLADRGETRTVWGATSRAESTRELWQDVLPPERTRLGWLIWPGGHEPNRNLLGPVEAVWPETTLTERRATLWVYAPVPSPDAAHD